MAKNNNLTDFLTDVANAIRAKTGETEAINPQDFSTKIANIMGDNSKLLSILDGSVTEITAEDLKGLTRIVGYGFANRGGLTSIEIPNTVTAIGQDAFYACTALMSIDVPASVTSIGNSAFRHVTSITVRATTPPALGSNVFNVNILTAIYVPAESVDAYKTATNWVSYADKIQAIEE